MSKFKTLIINNRKYVQKIGSDLIAIILLAIPVLVLFAVGKPYKRGFNCDDESIRYPFKDSTISSGLNYGYSTTIPIITIIIIEVVYHIRGIRKTERDGVIIVRNKGDIYWQIYCQLAPFAFGALISQMTTDIAKYSIGRLRPHFIDVCQPEFRNSDGQLVHFTLANYYECSKYQYKYITDFECQSTYDEYRQRDSRLSFMSGHSSFSSYCLVYLVIYLQVRLSWSALGFIRPLYQALLIYLVIYTGFSRISDYKHHWSDVLIGLIQGTVVAILATRFISNLFVKPIRDNTSTGSVTGSPGVLSPNRESNYESCRVEMIENISNNS